MKAIFKTVAILSLFVATVGCKQAPKYDLTDGEWALASWINDQGDEMVITQNRPTINFVEDNKVHGNAGCNNFNGRYEVNEESIEIDMGAMTLKMCLDMEIEDRMVAVMPTVDRFVIDGNQLILYAGEKELFRFDNTVVEEDNNQ